MAKKITQPLSFVARHAAASVISILFPIVLVVITYVIYILVFANGELGGVMVLPMFILLTFVASFAYTVLLLFPIVALSEFVSQIFGKWKHVAQIPLATLFLAVVSFVSALVAKPAQSVAAGRYDLLRNFASTFFVMAIALGVYWWAMKFAELIIWGGKSIFVHPKHKTPKKAG